MMTKEQEILNEHQNREDFRKELGNLVTKYLQIITPSNLMAEIWVSLLGVQQCVTEEYEAMKKEGKHEHQD